MIYPLLFCFRLFGSLTPRNNKGYILVGGSIGNYHLQSPVVLIRSGSGHFPSRWMQTSKQREQEHFMASSSLEMVSPIEDNRFQEEATQQPLPNKNETQCHQLDNTSIRKAIHHWQNFPKEAELLYGSINTWDTSRVTSMTNLFAGVKMFNEPIGDWDVSNVTDMTGMFEGCESFD